MDKEGVRDKAENHTSESMNGFMWGSASFLISIGSFPLQKGPARPMLLVAIIALGRGPWPLSLPSPFFFFFFFKFSFVLENRKN